ncbi:hypothetical protein PINS_up000141 [Pythium insidiosum]|nr:hypothetical protein PINS_up000141 [Pythium insidiosum]
MSHRGTQPEELDVAVLLQAMKKCNGFYHQTDKAEFYALVAEDYGAMIPEHEDVSISALASKERELRKVAETLLKDRKTAVIPSCIRPHVRDLLQFYESVGVYIAEENKECRQLDSALPCDDPATIAHVSPAHSLPDSPRSAHSKSEDVGHTDASASDSATPVVDDRGDDVPSETHVENGKETRGSTEPLPSTSSSRGVVTTDMVVQTQSTSTRACGRSMMGKISDQQVYSAMNELMQGQVQAQNSLLACEERLRVERASLQTARNEYKRMKVMIKEQKQREKERERLRRLMGGSSHSCDAVDERGARQGSDDKLIRKERKRLKRLQSELSLRFQLLESENKRFEMKVERQLEELRRQYENDVVFPNIFPSTA